MVRNQPKPDKPGSALSQIWQERVRRGWTNLDQPLEEASRDQGPAELEHGQRSQANRQAESETVRTRARPEQGQQFRPS